MVAGFICVTIHDLVLGPISYGPNNVLHQSAKKRHKAAAVKQEKAVEAKLKRQEDSSR